MGCPEIYYKQAIRNFAHALAYNMNGKDFATKLYEEKSDEIIENFIKEKKETCDEKQFYYDAGRASQLVQDMAENEGIDAFNACIGGLISFDQLIGLEEEDDD